MHRLVPAGNNGGIRIHVLYFQQRSATLLKVRNTDSRIRNKKAAGLISENVPLVDSVRLWLSQPELLQELVVEEARTRPIICNLLLK